MDYTSTDGAFSSTWSSIKLSWIAVSTEFETVTNPYGSYIWAGSVSTSTITGVQDAVIPNSLWSNVPGTSTTDAQCGYINTSPPHFDTTCASATDPKFITHLYIMGFKFNPNGAFHLGASALLNAGTTIDEALDSVDFIQYAAGDPSLTLTGPQMILDRFGSQL